MGLDIPVNNSLGVGMVEGAEHLGGEVDRFLPPQHLLLVDILLEGDAVNILHDDRLHPLGKNDVINLYNIGMGEDGNGLGLVLKHAGELLVGHVLLPEYLDRHHLVVHDILSLVHVGHTADADHLLNFVPSVQPLADKFIHWTAPPLPPGPQ